MKRIYFPAPPKDITDRLKELFESTTTEILVPGSFDELSTVLEQTGAIVTIPPGYDCKGDIAGLLESPGTKEHRSRVVESPYTLEDLGIRYLNNWILRLPGSPQREQELNGAMVYDWPSPLLRAKSPKQFYGEIDFALERSGVDTRELRGDVADYVQLSYLYNAMRKDHVRKQRHLSDMVSVRESLEKKTFSAYVGLREQGYSHDDLTS